MNLDAVELLVVRLPLVRPFVTATGTTEVRDVLLVHVWMAGAEGWGECSAETIPGYWHESVATAREVLPTIARGEHVDGNPMAFAAFEMAVLDAQLQLDGVALGDHLGATRTEIVATATVGLEDDIDAFLDAGYRSLKLKITPDVANRLPTLPADVTTQVDANGSFASVPDRVRDLDSLGLLCIEQPLARDDLAGHEALTSALHTPVCLDESVPSLDVLDTVIARRAAGAVAVKPARLGGLDAARRAHDRCVEAGIAAKVGGLLETGIGRAAALAVAALPGFEWPADLSASDRYWHDDLTEPFVLDASGCLPVPSAPGLGVTVRPDVIDAATVWRERVAL